MPQLLPRRPVPLHLLVVLDWTDKGQLRRTAMVGECLLSIRPDLILEGSNLFYVCIARLKKSALDG